MYTTYCRLFLLSPSSLFALRLWGGWWRASRFALRLPFPVLRAAFSRAAGDLNASKRLPCFLFSSGALFPPSALPPSSGSLFSFSPSPSGLWGLPGRVFPRAGCLFFGLARQVRASAALQGERGRGARTGVFAVRCAAHFGLFASNTCQGRPGADLVSGQ